MPPKGASKNVGKGKGKPPPSKKAKKTPEPEPPSTSEEEDDDEEDRDRDEDDEAADDDDDDQSSQKKSSREREKVDIEEVLCRFFEARTYFYDLADERYKDKLGRQTELEQLALELGPGWTGDNAWKRFVSLRTDYGKLRQQLRKGKSGSGAIRLTVKQKWKLSRLSFLDPFMRKSGAGTDEMGKVSICQDNIKISVVCTTLLA